MKRSGITRRSLLHSSAVAFAIVPSWVIGATGAKKAAARLRPPGERLNIAFIGAGGRAVANIKGLAPDGNNFVAFCDVDAERAAGTYKAYPSAKRYTDFRRMLDEMEKEIDAVVVSTPDHTHAVAAMDAIRRGKHVYCEKPLAHSIHEIRSLMGAAREKKVITQLGNQGHSTDSIRMFREWVQDGAIGSVHTIHAASRSRLCKIADLPKLAERPEVPATLDWDLWLGPAAPRPYHPMYVPRLWRAWTPFGSGAIGDWICHVVDPVFWALDLGAPTRVVAEAKDYDPKKHGDTFPGGTKIRFDFAARGPRGPVTLWWYDGDEKLPHPEGLEADRKVPETGALVLGDKGGILYGSHGALGLRIFPETKMREYKLPEKTIPRAVENNHYLDWLEAIRTKRPAGSNFDYGGPLTELAQLGIIATKLLGQELAWNGAAGRFANNERANELLNPPYRKGWTL